LLMAREIVFYGHYFLDFYSSLDDRIFCCFDQGRLVVLFNGFQKKSQKTPRIEIDRAMRLKFEYFNTELI